MSTACVHRDHPIRLGPLNAGRADIDALDQELDQPRLLGREQFGRELLEPIEIVPHLPLTDGLDRLLGGAPGCDHDLRGLNQRLDLSNDGGLDLGGRYAADWAIAGAGA